MFEGFHGVIAPKCLNRQVSSIILMKGKMDILERIAEWQKDPEFIRAADEFIKSTTS